MDEYQAPTSTAASNTSSERKPRSLRLFFVLAYAISWAVEIPLALKAQGLLDLPVPFSAHYLAAYGPMLSAIIVTWLAGGAEELRALVARMLRWRVRPLWWLVAFAPLLLYALTAVGLRAVQGRWPQLSALGQLNFLGDLGLAALPLWVLTFGIGEETGWRGYALPRLQARHGALSATLILWLLWSLWHLPLFFYSYEVTVIPGVVVGLLAGAITFTWLYNSTGGSVLLLAIWHGTFNYTTACTTCGDGATAAVVSTLVMVWAVLVVVLFKPARLSRAQKQVL